MTDDLVWIPAQTAILGSDDHYPEEAPARPVTVAGFFIQAHQVSNAQFAEFVDATGYVTVAERPLNPADVQTLTPDQTLSGAYGLVAYETPLFGITPYAMVEYEKGRINLLRISGAWGFTGGLNWRPHPRVTLKAQVLVSKQLGDASSPFTNTTITLADGQIAWAF